MKPEEALKQFKEWNETGWSKSETPSSEALVLSIQALEKQIQTKPGMYIGDYEFERWPICPKCKGELHPNGEKFCSDCGQRIWWGE